MLGIVLAGGLSRRMKTDKATIKLPQSPRVSLLDQARQRLYDSGCQDVLVSRNTPGYIPDIFPHMGPLAGIHACLQRYGGNADFCVVTPVDMPLLRSQDVRMLLLHSEQQQCASYFRESVLPCVLPLQASLLPYLEYCLQHRQLSVHRLLETLSATAIDTNDSLVLVNSNTPEQWQQVQYHLQQKCAQFFNKHEGVNHG